MAKYWMYMPPEAGSSWDAAVVSMPDSAEGVERMLGELDKVEAWARRHLDTFRDAPVSIFGLSRIPLSEGVCFGRIASPEGAAEEMGERFSQASGQQFDCMAPKLLTQEEAQTLCGSSVNLDSEWADSGAVWMWGSSGARQDFCVSAGKEGDEPSFSVACGFWPSGDDAWVGVQADLASLRHELEKGLRLMQEEESAAAPMP